jgi:LacI family transcriptional regulator
MAAPRTTIREVAKRCGVSPGTVSRALNGYTDVAAATRERILRVAAELEYMPAAAARTLVTQRSRVVGVFLETGEGNPDLQHPFFHQVLVGFKHAIGRAGYDLLLFANDQPNNDFGAQAYLNRCRHHNVEGAVLMGVDADDPEVRRLVRSEVPCIGFDVDLGGDAVFVASDNEAGASLAVQHLVELGHRRIATIAGLMHTRPSIDRLRGYRRALQAHGLAFRDEYVVHGDFYVESGGRAMRQLLALDEPPTAVFADSDLMAIGAIQTATAAGLRVPDDVAVVGFDDIPLAPHLRPSLTTIRQDATGLGTRAGDLLVRWIEGDGADGAQGRPSSVVLPVELVVRESTVAGRAAATTGPKGAGRA